MKGGRKTGESARSSPGVRRIAADILAEGAGFADEAVNAACERWKLDARDRRSLTRIVFETIRRRALLDAVIRAYSRKSVQSLPPGLVAPLRIAVFELLHSSGTPPWAAVHEAVESVKVLAGPGESRFANAVLRNLTRGMRFLEVDEEARETKHVLLLADGRAIRFDRRVFPGPSRTAENLAMRHSHPEFIVESWRRIFGDEGTKRILREDNRAPPLSVRLRAGATPREESVGELRREGRETEKGRWDDVYFSRGGGGPASSASFERGDWVAQDETASGPVRALSFHDGMLVLDLCAAPGGKTVQAADRMEGRGSLVSADVSRARLALAVEAAGRTGAGPVFFLVADGTRAPFPSGVFDAVLVDAPCSNSGVLRRRPEARWRIRPGTARERARVQRRLLDEAARCLGPGGRAIYSTCSIDPVENQETVSAFLAGRGDFRLLAEETVLPGRADGGYWAVLTREGGTRDAAPPRG